MEITQKDLLALIGELKKISKALEESNELKKKELVYEKKRYNRDYSILEKKESSDQNDTSSKK